MHMLTLLLLLLLRRSSGIDLINNTRRRRPAATLPWLDALHVHGIDFLEGTALGLVDEEEDDKQAGEAAGCEDVAVGKVDRVGDERREE